MKVAQMVAIFGVVILLILSDKPPRKIDVSAPIVVSLPEAPKSTMRIIQASMSKPVVRRRSGGVGAFMTHMSKAESGHNPTVVNQYGMMGKYQFAPTTMRGILGPDVTNEQFLQDESLQDEAMLRLMKRNKRFLQKVINEFAGQVIDNIQITESGILGAAHLVGPGGVLAFFYPEKHSHATVDRNGTTAAMYLEKFAGYSLTEL